MKRSQKLFAFFFLAGFLLLAFAPFIFAQQSELEIKYPELCPPDASCAESPNTTRELPSVIKYLFNLGIAVSGFIAFGSFVYGGIKYLFSAGNVAALQDARDQIAASLLGIVVLFGSYMLLTTINPQLVVLQLSKTGAARAGIILYTQAGCPAESATITEGGKSRTIEEGKDYMRVKGNLSFLPDTFTKQFNSAGQVIGDKSIKSIKFLSSSDEVTVALYPNIDYRPTNQPIWNSEKYPEGIYPTVLTNGCVSGDKLNAGGATSGELQAKSITLNWKSPGIYLFAGDNCTGETRLFGGNTSNFGDFDDKAQSLMIKPTLEQIPDGGSFKTEVKEKLGAILYENTNFKDRANVFTGGNDPKALGTPQCIPLTGSKSKDCNMATDAGGSEPYCTKKIERSASSLLVFRQNVNGGDPGGLGVIAFANYQWNEQPKGDRGNDNIHCGPINTLNSEPTLGIGKPLWVTGSYDFNGPPDDVLYNDPINPDKKSTEKCSELFDRSQISSISVDGNYMGVLFRDDGRGEAFLSPGDIRLKDNHIQDDSAKFLLVIPLHP